MKIFRITFFIGIILAHPLSAIAAPPPLDFTVNLSEPVVVDTTGGTPSIPITVDNTTSPAAFLSGSGTNTLTFRYSPTAGDLDLNGIALGSSISLNSGTIKDTAGNNATLTFTAPNTANVKIDYPSLSLDFTNGSTGRYTRNGQSYTSLSSFLSDAGGTFSRASTATYFDSTGTMQTAATNAPRFDYDPSTLTLKGLLIEEQRTNYIINSTMLGAVAGSPGTNPTGGWGILSMAGLTHSINAVGTEYGMNYIDIRYAGTTTGTQVQFNPGYSTSVFGETWSFSIYSKLISGSMGTLNAGFRACINESSSTNIYLGEGCGTPVAIDSQLRRIHVSRANTSASTAYSTAYMKFTPAAGQTLDFVIRVYAPQFEKGAFPTSFIPTSTAAATRSADSLTIPTGTWFNSSYGTILANSVNGVNTSAAGIISIDNSSTPDNDRITLIRTGTTSIEALVRDSSAIFFQTGVASTGNNSLNKSALAYNSNDFRQAVNGTLGSLDTTGSIPTVNQLRVGVWSGTAYYDGWIQKIKYYPFRITDTQLQLLTQ